jgi:predicted DNA-binding transcriptional regulator AlpA
MEEDSGGPVLMRKHQALQFVGLRNTQFDEKVATGELPAPIKISDSGRAVAWLRVELERWLEQRIMKRDAEAKAKRKPARRAK